MYKSIKEIKIEELLNLFYIETNKEKQYAEKLRIARNNLQVIAQEITMRGRGSCISPTAGFTAAQG